VGEQGRQRGAIRPRARQGPAPRHRRARLVRAKTKKGGRPATGSIKWQYSEKYKKDCWHGRVSEADGSRPFVALDPNIPERDREGALAAAVINTKTVRQHPISGTKAFETTAKWWIRFHAHKERIGLSSVEDMRGRAKELDPSEHRAQVAAHRDARGHRSDREALG
jgi:hypothetical protein